MCLYGAAREAGLRDEDIEKMLNIETGGIVAIWRQRGREGNWAIKREWVESELEEKQIQRFGIHEQMELLRESIDVAALLLKKCRLALDGKEVSFAPGAKTSARTITEGIQRAHVIINKDAAKLAELEESIGDERHAEEERIRRILRQVVRMVKWTPEQLEALRKEFPGMLPVVSEIMPRVVAEV